MAASGVTRDGERVDLGGRSALILAFDPELPPPRLENAGEVVWVGQAPAGRAWTQVPWSALRALRPDARLRRLAGSDAIVATLRGADVRDLLAAIRLGVRRFHVIGGPGWVFRSNARGVLALALRRSLGRRLARVPGLSSAVQVLVGRQLDLPWPALHDTRHVLADVLRLRRARPPARRARPERRIVHYVSALGPGGAERQLSYVASASRRAGDDVRVLTTSALTGDDAHYAPALAEAGVACRALPLITGAVAPADLPPELGRRLERHLAWPCVASLLDALRRDPPDVLHCWLDFPNVVGALAGLLAGVPRIVVSARSVNPTHFPDLDLPWLRASYRWLSRCPDVTFVANSLAGARDYAAWIGVREERFRVVHNGVPLPAPPRPAERLAERRALGVPEGVFLVVGVLRLSAEKRPGDFVAALRAACARAPHLRAVHVGAGPLEEETRRAAAALGGALSFAGRLPDPGRWLRVADACLLTSEQEGCPNVLLEAQALGVPVVTTRAGGAPETVAEGQSGLIAEVGATDELAAHLVSLASDPARARAMGEAGRRLVAERFSIDAMVERTLGLYA